MIEDSRMVLCEACGSEGRIYVAHTVFDSAAGGYITDQRDTGPCGACDGTGREVILTEPITLEDLDIIFGGGWT